MFENQKILVLGFARSGYEVAKVLIARHNEVIVTDLKNDDKEKEAELVSLGVKVVITDKQEDLLDESFDYVVKNPGIRLDNPTVVKAASLNIPVINELEVAYNLLPKNVKIIGITGSNGKTTTTTMTYEVLKNAGLPVHLGGNIGIPMSGLLKDVKENDYLVLEISGHQMHDFVDFKVDIAVMTNLSVVHVDHFGTYENYKYNKCLIFRHQTESDLAILNLENEDVLEGSRDIPSSKLYFSSVKKADSYLKDNKIYYKDEEIIDTTNCIVKGNHNAENMMCAILVAKHLGVSNEIIKETLENFKGVEHRIEYVANINERTFYNDSKSTNVKSTQIALSAFQKPTIILLGGLDRNLPFDDLKDYMSNVKAVVCYGETKHKIADFVNSINIDCYIKDTLRESVHKAYELSNEGDVILLSPACASWDQYKSFEERGCEFKQIVLEELTK